MPSPFASPLLRRCAYAALATLWLARPAFAAESSPFAPSTKPPELFRLLAYADDFDPAVIEEAERAIGLPVAYDSYDSPDQIAERLRATPYDVVVAPGAAIAQGVAAGALRRLDLSAIPNARNESPGVAAKLAVFDPGNAHALVYAWFATGLLIDTEKAGARIPAGAESWAVAFAPEASRRFADCGIAAPADRDALFMAAWRFLGANTAKLTPLDARRAGEALLRLKSATHGFTPLAAGGALAGGEACIAIGRRGEAAAAEAQARESGRPLSVRFAIPKEGAPMSLDAFAIPASAPHLAQAQGFINFMLRPDVAARNSRATGLANGGETGDEAILKRLTPAGVADLALATLVEREWQRVLNSK
jgi:putrescine transport system substrate-binding protein